MAKGRRCAERSSQLEGSDEQLKMKEVERMAETFRELLSPLEGYIMTFQSLLVWEKPPYSAALVVTVNVVFWLATLMRTYTLIGLTGASIIFIHTWFKIIWPEFFMDPSCSGNEDWTPVHPNLLSVPEICQILAEAWVSFSSFITAVAKLRKEHHAKFFLWMTPSFCVLAMLGHYVNGITVSYVTVMMCLLWPGVVYHNLIEKAKEKILPAMSGFEEKMNIKRIRTKRQSSRLKKKRGTEKPKHDDSDTSDEELQAFVPRPDSKTIKRTLARAVKDLGTEEEDDGSSSLLLSPPSATDLQGSSREHSEYDTEDDHEFSLAKNVKQMPDPDDIDSLLSLSLPVREMPSMVSLGTIEKHETEDVFDTTMTPTPSPSRSESTSTGISQSESMHFEPTHYKVPTDSDNEESLAVGMEFPDVHDVAEQEHAQSETVRNQLTAAIANEMVANTVSSILSSTMSGLGKLGETVKAATGGASANLLTANIQDSSQSASRAQARTASRDKETVEESFEFLDREELESFDVSDDDNTKA